MKNEKDSKTARLLVKVSEKLSSLGVEPSKLNTEIVGTVLGTVLEAESAQAMEDAVTKVFEAISNVYSMALVAIGESVDELIIEDEKVKENPDKVGPLFNLNCGTCKYNEECPSYNKEQCEVPKPLMD